MSWPEEMNVLRIKFSDFFSVFFLYVCLVILTYLFHDSSYIKRQTLSGGVGCIYSPNLLLIPVCICPYELFYKSVGI